MVKFLSGALLLLAAVPAQAQLFSGPYYRQAYWQQYYARQADCRVYNAELAAINARLAVLGQSQSCPQQQPVIVNNVPPAPIQAMGGPVGNYPYPNTPSNPVIVNVPPGPQTAQPQFVPVPGASGMSGTVNGTVTVQHYHQWVGGPIPVQITGLPAGSNVQPTIVLPPSPAPVVLPPAPVTPIVPPSPPNMPAIVMVQPSNVPTPGVVPVIPTPGVTPVIPVPGVVPTIPAPGVVPTIPTPGVTPVVPGSTTTTTVTPGVNPTVPVPIPSGVVVPVVPPSTPGVIPHISERVVFYRTKYRPYR